MFAVPPTILRIWHFIRRIIDAYDRHFGDLMAAAVAFYALLSLIPLLSFGVAILGFIIGSSEQALLHVKDAIQSFLPAQGELIYKTLTEIKRGSGIIGAISLVGLIISASAIFTKLEIAFNNIWGVKTMRPWWKQRLVALGSTLLILAIMLSSIAITSALSYVENVHVPGVDFRASQIPFLWQILGRLVPLALSILMFTLTYKIVPYKPIQWKEALIGGAFAGCAWELAKYGFTFYLTHFANYQKVYGSLGAPVVLMVWAYYSTTILFIGAEIAADRGTKLPAADRPPENAPVVHPPGKKVDGSLGR